MIEGRFDFSGYTNLQLNVARQDAKRLLTYNRRRRKLGLDPIIPSRELQIFNKELRSFVEKL